MKPKPDKQLNYTPTLRAEIAKANTQNCVNSVVGSKTRLMPGIDHEVARYYFDKGVESAMKRMRV